LVFLRVFTIHITGQDTRKRRAKNEKPTQNANIVLLHYIGKTDLVLVWSPTTVSSIDYCVRL
jgi:hypothetical protein